MSLATILAINLVGLPGAVRDIRETHAELQRVAVRGVRDQIQLFLGEKEQALKSQTMLFRPPFLEGDQAALRQLCHRFFQREPAFVEIGILDTQGQEHLRISRILAVTNPELGDRSASALFQEGKRREVYWGPVTTSETSEPWVTLAVPLKRSKADIAGVVYGILNLKSLWELTGELQLSHGGRAYVVDQQFNQMAAQLHASYNELEHKVAGKTRDLETKAVRFQTLTRLNQLVSASLDMDAVLREIATAAARLMEAPFVQFWIVDEPAQLLTLRVLSDERMAADFPGRTRRFGQGVVGWAALYRQPLNIPDVFDDERVSGLDWWRAHG